MGSELKPCPFCGKPAHRTDIKAGTSYYGCGDNECAGYAVMDTPERWNRRASPVYQTTRPRRFVGRADSQHE